MFPFKDVRLRSRGSRRNTAVISPITITHIRDYSAQLLNALRPGKATSSSLPFAYKAAGTHLFFFLLWQDCPATYVLRAAAFPLRLTWPENSIKSDLKHDLCRERREPTVSRDYLPHEISASLARESKDKEGDYYRDIGVARLRKRSRQISYYDPQRILLQDLARGYIRTFSSALFVTAVPRLN